jgi:hypothetical protein
MLKMNLLYLIGFGISSKSYAAKPESFTLSLSPKKFLETVGELQVELPLPKSYSVTAITAYGRDDSAKKIELGVQGRFYPIGNFFTGGYLGSELRYSNIIYRDTDQFNAFFIQPSIFIGAKYQFDIGFTIDAHFGGLHKQTIVNSLDDGSVITLANWDLISTITLGWTFKKSPEEL